MLGRETTRALDRLWPDSPPEPPAGLLGYGVARHGGGRTVLTHTDPMEYAEACREVAAQKAADKTNYRWAIAEIRVVP